MEVVVGKPDVVRENPDVIGSKLDIDPREQEAEEGPSYSNIFR
jgi:hypothetical protein